MINPFLRIEDMLRLKSLSLLIKLSDIFVAVVNDWIGIAVEVEIGWYVAELSKNSRLNTLMTQEIASGDKGGVSTKSSLNCR